MIHVLAALALQVQGVPDRIRLEEDPAITARAEEKFHFDLRARMWYADEGKTRVRSMEQEALNKGGNGRGTTLQLEDVGMEGYSLIPELEGRISYGNHEVWSRGSQTRRKSRFRLSQDIEYDGDLHAAGELVESDYQMTMIEGGYSYRVLSGKLEVRIGAEFAYWEWKGAINSLEGGETSDEVIPTILLPVPTLSLRWALSDRISWNTELAFQYGIDLRRGVSMGANSQGMFRLTSELEAQWGPVLFSLGVGYSMQDSVSLEHKDEADSLHYRRLGASFGITLRF